MNTSVSSEQKLFSQITISLIVTFAVLFYYIHESEDALQKIQQLSYSLLIWFVVVFVLFLFINKEKRTCKQTVHFSLVTGILIGVLFFNIAQGDEIGRILTGCSLAIPMMLILKHCIF